MKVLYRDGNEIRTLTPVVLDNNYIQLKNQVIKAERRVLKELGFCVHIKHPHKIIVMYLQVLGYEKHQQLMQYSWNYMNDSLRTDVFVRYQPETVACACIYLTARKLKLPLPKNPAWFSLFGVTEQEIRDVCLRILRLYARPKINVDILEKKIEELCRKYQDAKIKARGNSGNNTPNINSPSSPSTQKSSGAHNAWGGFISRSGSHIVPAAAEKRSRSKSHSHSPVNKHHKRAKKHARSRSRSQSRNHKKGHKRRSSYSRSHSKSPHKNSRKTRDKRRSRSVSNDKELKNDRYIDRYDKHEKNDRYSKEERYNSKEERDRDRYIDKDRYEEKMERKDRHEKNDKRYEREYREDKYKEDRYKDERHSNRDEKDRYKKMKHRDEDKERDRLKDRRR